VSKVEVELFAIRAEPAPAIAATVCAGISVPLYDKTAGDNLMHG